MARSEQLARSEQAELDVALSHRDQLVATARSLALATHHDAGIADCRDAGCSLAETGHAALCAPAHRLAAVTPGAVEVLPVALVAASFRRQLSAALDAVRACRQTAHPSGVCWFSAEPGADGCAEVLRLAHASSRP